MCEISLVPVSRSLIAVSALAVQCKKHSSIWAYRGWGLIVICQLTVVHTRTGKESSGRCDFSQGLKLKRAFAQRTLVLRLPYDAIHLFLFTGSEKDGYICTQGTLSVFLKQMQECYCTLCSRLCFKRWLLHANDTYSLCLRNRTKL